MMAATAPPRDPHINSGAAWNEHFEKMASTGTKNIGGFYRLKRHKQKEAAPEKPIKVVAASAQLLDQARAQLKREEKNYMKKKVANSRKAPSKRRRKEYSEDEAEEEIEEEDFFSF